MKTIKLYPETPSKGLKDNSNSMGVELLGTIISNIINQDGDEKTDGKIIDEIVEELKKYNLYKERE